LQYRSPEEFRGDFIDEKVDVYSMGNNIYTLLTGLWPFYESSIYAYAIKRVKSGIRPYVDERYRKRSYIEAKLVEIMEKMWAQEPTDRPDIFEVLSLLKEIKKNHEEIWDAKDAR
jgi:serine/threonine protein kinase